MNNQAIRLAIGLALGGIVTAAMTSQPRASVGLAAVSGTALTLANTPMMCWDWRCPLPGEGDACPDQTGTECNITVDEETGKETCETERCATSKDSAMPGG